MELFDTATARQWCASQGIHEQRDWMSRLSFRGGYPVGLRVRVPTEDRGTVALASLLATFPAGQSPFGGALLWLQTWKIWSEEMDRTGQTMLSGLRREDALAENFDVAPAQLFSGDEFKHAVAEVTVPLLFQWDAHLVPAQSQEICSISHDGYVDLRFRTPARYREWLERCRDSNWEHQSLEV